jgi:hypothetical protein
MLGSSFNDLVLHKVEKDDCTARVASAGLVWILIIDDDKIQSKHLVKEIADTEHRADKTHHREIKQGADCQQ